MLKIKKNYATVTYIYILLSFLLLLSTNLLSNQDYQIALRTFGFMVIIQFTITLVAYNLINIDFLSLSGIFTWLNYLFHLGQPVIKATSPEYKLAFDVSLYVPDAIFIESLKYSLLSITLVSVGIMVYKCLSQDTNKKRTIKRRLSNVSQNSLFKFGLIIFLPTFFIEVYIQLSRLIVAMNRGYLATFDVELGGLLGFFSSFSIVGVIMLILGSKNNYKRGAIITALYTAFYLITMFSGGRMWQIIKLSLVFYYFVKVYKIKFTKKNVIVFLVVAYFGAGFLGAIAEFRAYDFSSSDYIFQMFRDVIRNNPILDVLDEFGGSIYTLSLTIGKTPHEVPHSWGEQFITNFVSVLPNINSSIQEINNNSNYVLLLNTPTIGGSFIGEIYYSFHYLGTIFAFFVGILTQYFTSRIENGLNNNDYHFIIYTIMIQYSFISWVRGSSGIFYRNTIFSIVIIYVLTNVLIKEKPAKGYVNRKAI